MSIWRVETLLTQRLGPVAGKLHTARSRNDQVATDLRLYLRDAVDGSAGNISPLCSGYLSHKPRRIWRRCCRE